MIYTDIYGLIVVLLWHYAYIPVLIYTIIQLVVTSIKYVNGHDDGCYPFITAYTPPFLLEINKNINEATPIVLLPVFSVLFWLIFVVLCILWPLTLVYVILLPVYLVLRTIRMRRIKNVNT